MPQDDYTKDEETAETADELSGWMPDSPAVDGDNVPFKTPDEDIDAIEFDVSSLGEAAPTDDIEKMVFRPFLPGRHITMVKEVKPIDGGTPVYSKVFVKQVNGQVVPMDFFSRKVSVTFCDPNDKNVTIRDQFLLPPPRAQMEGYVFGCLSEESAKKEPRGGASSGFWSRKFKQFCHRNGFLPNSKGELPPEAGKLSLWVKTPDGRPKFISLIVTPPKVGKPYKDKKTGQMITPTAAYSSVGMYSYRQVELPARPEQPKAHQSPAVNTEPSKPATEPAVEAPAKKGGKAKAAQL